MKPQLRILVVDDHPINRFLCKEIFQELGCVVETADNGELALASAAARTFDLICLERHMPGLSGDDVATRLPADQFVVAWTADQADLPARFNGVLAKPVTALSAAVTLAWARLAAPGAMARAQAV